MNLEFAFKAIDSYLREIGLHILELRKVKKDNTIDISIFINDDISGYVEFCLNNSKSEDVLVVSAEFEIKGQICVLTSAVSWSGGNVIKELINVEQAHSFFFNSSENFKEICTNALVKAKDYLNSHLDSIIKNRLESGK